MRASVSYVSLVYLNYAWLEVYFQSYIQIHPEFLTNIKMFKLNSSLFCTLYLLQLFMEIFPRLSSSISTVIETWKNWALFGLTPTQNPPCMVIVRSGYKLEPYKTINHGHCWQECVLLKMGLLPSLCIADGGHITDFGRGRCSDRMCTLDGFFGRVNLAKCHNLRLIVGSNLDGESFTWKVMMNGGQFSSFKQCSEAAIGMPLLGVSEWKNAMGGNLFSISQACHEISWNTNRGYWPPGWTVGEIRL